ncbi:MAG: hypothetical protein PHV82_11865 [Victivallaceae bacterium]|nr:hypothetical protein [Victivallaceae bacterium]
MQIPIIKAGQPMPESDPAYVIGRNGFYLRKTSRLYESLAKIEAIPDFEPVTERLNWTAPKLPYALLEEALDFFRAVYDRYEAEAILLLTLNDERWQNVVPEQEVSGAKLDYQLPKITGLAGTIHSHGNMDAFFSGTDHQDVAGFDGIHIVLGKIDRNLPRIKAGVYANGRLFEFEPEDLIDGIPPEHQVNLEHPWLARVRSGRGASDLFKPEMMPENRWLLDDCPF